MKSISKAINSRVLTYLVKKPLNLRKIKNRGCISFSFDDFPSSAANTGVEILNAFGVKGTFYTSLGLQDNTEYGKKMFSTNELIAVLRNEHEIGCHTFDHVDCSKTEKKGIKVSMDKNIAALTARLEGAEITSFAYPKGRAKLAAKKLVNERYVSSRTTKSGINYDGDDANLLKAQSIYSRTLDLAKCRRMMEEAAQTGGWLIFYTHDVEDLPSDFGCRPEELRTLVEHAVKSGAWVLPVGKVIVDV